jgi:hypothetical protein
VTIGGATHADQRLLALHGSSANAPRTWRAEHHRRQQRYSGKRLSVDQAANCVTRTGGSRRTRPEPDDPALSSAHDVPGQLRVPGFVLAHPEFRAPPADQRWRVRAGRRPRASPVLRGIRRHTGSDRDRPAVGGRRGPRPLLPAGRRSQPGSGRDRQRGPVAVRVVLRLLRGVRPAGCAAGGSGRGDRRSRHHERGRESAATAGARRRRRGGSTATGGWPGRAGRVHDGRPGGGEESSVALPLAAGFRRSTGARVTVRAQVLGVGGGGHRFPAQVAGRIRPVGAVGGTGRPWHSAHIPPGLRGGVPRRTGPAGRPAAAAALRDDAAGVRAERSARIRLRWPVRGRSRRRPSG